MPTIQPHPTVSPLWTDVLAALTAAGAAAGRAAAEWWAQDTIGGRATGDTRTVAARVLAGLDDIDPEVVDALPACDLSGQWTDEPGEADLYREHTPPDAPDWHDLDGPARDEAADAYRDSYDTAVHDHVAAACRTVLDDGPLPAQSHHTTPTTESCSRLG